MVPDNMQSRLIESRPGARLFTLGARSTGTLAVHGTSENTTISFIISDPCHNPAFVYIGIKLLRPRSGSIRRSVILAILLMSRIEPNPEPTTINAAFLNVCSIVRKASLVHDVIADRGSVFSLSLNPGSATGTRIPSNTTPRRRVTTSTMSRDPIQPTQIAVGDWHSSIGRISPCARETTSMCLAPHSSASFWKHGQARTKCFL